MHFLKQLRFVAALLAAFFVLSLTACGSGSNSFTWFVDSIPANLDPQVASSASDIIACENLYSSLVRRTPDAASRRNCVSGGRYLPTGSPIHSI
mgnify:CR=1 FL=1